MYREASHRLTDKSFLFCKKTKVFSASCICLLFLCRSAKNHCQVFIYGIVRQQCNGNFTAPLAEHEFQKLTIFTLSENFEVAITRLLRHNVPGKEQGRILSTGKPKPIPFYETRRRRKAMNKNNT